MSQSTDPTVSLPLTDIVKKYGGTVTISGGRKTSYQKMAEELMAQMEIDRHRAAAVSQSLNAMLEQYQVAQASIRRLQAAQEETRAHTQKLLDFRAEQDAAEGTDTKGE